MGERDAALSPSLEVAHAFLQARLRGGQPPSGVLVVVGRCRVEYHGRAASRIDSGDRLLLFKRDGSLLLHGPTSVKPVNWQPPGARFEVALRDGELLVFARRAKPVEVIEARFSSVSLCWLGALEDAAPLQLSGTEFDLRDLLRDRPELVVPGFRPWARERLTDQGPMDLYGEDAEGRRVVVEVKRTAAGLAEATQLWRYVESERARRAMPVRGILLAASISPRAKQFLDEHDLEFVARHWNDEHAKAARRRTAPQQPSLQRFLAPETKPERSKGRKPV